MDVDWNQSALGMSLVEIRDLMKAAGSGANYTERSISARLLPANDRRFHTGRYDEHEPYAGTLARARDILRMLAASGLIQAPSEPGHPHGEEPRHPGYAPTNAALSLMKASKAPRFTRAKADAAVTELRKAVARAAADDSLMYDIEEVAIYGSYLTDSETLGDIDVAFSVKSRWKNAQDFRSRRRRLEKAHPPSKAMARAYDYQYNWALDSVKRLISPGRRINLTEIEHVRALGCPLRLIHPVERDEPARDGWTGERNRIVLQDDDGAAISLIEKDIARLMNGGVEPGTGDMLRSNDEYDEAIRRSVMSLSEDEAEKYDEDDRFGVMVGGIADAIAVLVGREDHRDLTTALDSGLEIPPPGAIPLELGALLLDRDVPVRPHALLFCTFPAIAAKHGYVPGMQSYTVPHGSGNVSIDWRRRPADHRERLRMIMERAGEPIDAGVADAILASPSWGMVYRGGFTDAMHALDRLLGEHLGVAARPLADIMLAMRGLRFDSIQWAFDQMPDRSGKSQPAAPQIDEGMRVVHTAQPLTDEHLRAAGYEAGAHRRAGALRYDGTVFGFLPWQIRRLSVGHVADPSDRKATVIAFVDVHFRDGHRRRITMDDLDLATAPSEAPSPDASVDEMMPLITSNLRIAFISASDAREGRYEAGWTYGIERGGKRPYDPDEIRRHWAQVAGRPFPEKAPPKLVLKPSEMSAHVEGFHGIFGRSGGGGSYQAGPPGPEPEGRETRWTSRDIEPDSEL